MIMSANVDSVVACNASNPIASKHTIDRRLSVVKNGIRRPVLSEIDPRNGIEMRRKSVDKAAGILIQISEM